MNEKIATMAAGAQLDGVYVVGSCNERTTRNGNPYLTLSIRDASGELPGRIWSPDQVAPRGVDAPGIYRLGGRIESYREQLQAVVESLRPADSEEIDHARLIATSAWPRKVIENEIRQHIADHVESEGLRTFLISLLDDEAVADPFFRAPAATANHHAYRGGLAEHTLSMMRIATDLARHYDGYYPGFVRGDLLIAGALLHDLGKIWEISGELGAEYTTAGRLVGHIAMGSEFVGIRARAHGALSNEEIHELQHLVLSHHGELEYGAPKRPKTIEALLLHYVDQIDSKANALHRESRDVDGWTPYLRNYGRAFWFPQPQSVDDPTLPDDGPGGRRASPDASHSAGHADVEGSKRTGAKPKKGADAPSLNLFDGLDAD